MPRPNWGRYARNLHERFKSNPRSSFELFQAVMNKGSVFVNQRRQIRDSRDCGYIPGDRCASRHGQPTQGNCGNEPE